MKKYISPLLFLLTSIIWGFAFAVQKHLSVIPVFTIGVSRGIFASLFLFAAIPLMDKILGNGRKFISKKGLDFTKTEIVGGIACGIILAAGSALQQSGIGGGTDAGKAAFISALYVLIVPIVSLFGGKRSPLNVWIAVALAIGGFYLLCVDGGFNIEFSDLLVLLCAVVFAFHIIVIDHFSPRCDGVRMSCIQFFTVFVVSLPPALIFEGVPNLAAIGAILPELLYYGVCSGGLAYTLQIIGQKDADPAVASIILSLESVFGAIGGAILLHEVMEYKEYIGCAVVFVAIILAQLDFKSIASKIRKKAPDGAGTPSPTPDGK